MTNDVIHIAEIGKLKYVHGTIDTYSDFLSVTAQNEEVIKHSLKCFSYMGIPKNDKNR